MQAVLNEKQNIMKTVQSLPENTSIEEAMERLFLLYKIEKGVVRLIAGKLFLNLKLKSRWENGSNKMDSSGA